VTDHYVAGVYRWWHLSVPSAELLAAESAGALGEPGLAIDLGCGLGTEAGYLTGRGWRGLGVDLSMPALAGAHARHPGTAFASADVTRLPLRSGVADLLLDRGCFHYLSAAGRARYAAEAARVLRNGGRLLLRMCLNSAGIPNGLDEGTIHAAFRDWRVASIERADLSSDTRTMPAVVALLVRPGSGSHAGRDTGGPG
jgi:SAM-dependent methyltransferase